MPSLKDFRTRIASVKNTRKITSAMKMVAASKLRQAQMRAEAGRPYAQHMGAALERLIAAIGQRGEAMPILDGRAKVRHVLYVVVAADRGLAGGFNTNVVREMRRNVMAQLLEDKHVSIITVGRKARDLAKREFSDNILAHYGLEVSYATADKLTTQLIDMFADHKFDEAHVVYSAFKNVITQVPSVRQLVPFVPETNTRPQLVHTNAEEAQAGVYTFEPDAMTLLQRLIPQQIAAQIYSVLLESAAGEHAARMTAMDNATRNAGDMINRVTLQYNRARQAYITKEVSEIVAGAEASA